MKGDYCSYRNCGKKAVGFESRGNGMSLNVCEDHSSYTMKKMSPGSTVGEPGSGNYHHKYEV